MSVYKKLMQVQQELKAPKGQYNKFSNFYYRSCEDIQEAVKPLLQKFKAVLTVNDELVLIGSRYYLKATARFTDIEDGTHIENTAFAREPESKKGMDEAQVTGSCSSYARKYALNGLFCIDDAKDPDYPQPDKQESKPQPKPQNKPAQKTAATQDNISQIIGKEEQAQLTAEADRTGTDLSKVCERYGVMDISFLTKFDYMRAMSAFQKMPDLIDPELPFA